MSELIVLIYRETDTMKVLEDTRGHCVEVDREWLPAGQPGPRAHMSVLPRYIGSPPP
jgi:hypothetical protein